MKPNIRLAVLLYFSTLLSFMLVLYVPPPIENAQLYTEFFMYCHGSILVGFALKIGLKLGKT